MYEKRETDGKTIPAVEMGPDGRNDAFLGEGVATTDPPGLASNTHYQFTSDLLFVIYLHLFD